GNGSNSNGVYKGIAWGASLVIHAMNDDAGANIVFPPNDLNDLFATAYASANGSARIHTNSWGGTTNTYSSDSNEIDTFAWNYKNMTILFSAGNSGGGGSDGSGGTNKTVGVQANAKNAIIVGATETNRSGQGVDADNIDQVADFSSRGSAADGRVKPDLVAPGTFIISSLSVRSGIDPCGDGNVNANYTYCSGTSMATPLVAGAAAIVRQYYVQNRSEVNPTSALVKATLINGATDSGYGIPHNYTGWGRVNLTNTLFPPAPRKFSYVNNQSGLNASGLVNYTFVVSNTTVQFKATLVWTDYPASASTGSSKALVNNLDMTVVAPNGSQYFGNDFLSPFNDTRDSLNNVEQVIISSPAAGTYRIVVNGTSVPQNPQPFAIVVSGGIGNNTAPNITSFSPSSASVNITEPNNQTFNVTANDAENDTLTLDWYVNGTLQAAAQNTNFTFLGNFSQATRQVNGTYNVTAVLSDGSL
ncbi:MAG: S8 family serine peptidase, partial [Nanoarchaeota archaeon]